MTGIHFILLLLPRKSIWGRGDILSHSLIMTQWSMAVPCFLWGFHSSAGQQATRKPKLFSRYWGTAGRQQGSRGPAAPMGEHPLRQLLIWSSSWGCSKGCLGDSDPYLYPSPWSSMLCKGCSLNNTFSVRNYCFLSHIQISEKDRLETVTIGIHNLFSLVLFQFRSLTQCRCPHWTRLHMN